MTATKYASASWWTADEYQAFVDAYGYDVMSWTSGFDVLRRGARAQDDDVVDAEHRERRRGVVGDVLRQAADRRKSR
jgi:hypothetical protein